MSCAERRPWVRPVAALGRTAVRCRALLAAAAAALVLAPIPTAAEAQDYPARPVRLVVPFAAGSATDSLARILAQELSQRLGQNVVVEDRPGAFGQLAAVHVAKSAPDGYTVLMSTNTTHSANPHLYKTLPYDPMRDFEPVARATTLPFVLVVSPSLPVKSAAGLIGHARSHPGELTFASASSTSLVAAKTLQTVANLDLTGVMYKASPQAVLDVASGQVHMMVADLATALPHVGSGKVRVLAVTTARRSPLLPDTPPLSETLKGFDVTSWQGLFVPAGTPRPVVARLSKEVIGILERRDIASKLAALGFEDAPLDPAAFAHYLREQHAYWGRLIRAAGIQPE